MKDLIVDALKKQLLKLALAGLIAGALFGFRIYQISGDESGDAVYQEAVERDLAESEETAADEGSEGSIWSWAGSDDEGAVASNRAIPCYIDGTTQYMMQNDCVTRGGMPQH